jgi:hypothetical protein
MKIYILLLLGYSSYAATLSAEVEALRAIYGSSGGDNWTCEGTDWDFSSTDPCSDLWKGIHCNDTASNCRLRPCSVLELILPECGLVGTLPSDITQLQLLEVLNLETNNIIGQ